MDVNSEDVKEKRDKAGHPLFIVIIFVALLGFLFFIPDIYKKYNSEISDFLGIGKEEQDKKPEEDNKTNRSAFCVYIHVRDIDFERKWLCDSP